MKPSTFQLLAICLCLTPPQSNAAGDEEALRQRIRIRATLREVVLKDFSVDHAAVTDAVSALNAAIVRAAPDAAPLPVKISPRVRDLKTWAKLRAPNIGINDALDIITSQTGTCAEVKGAEIVIDVGCDFAKDLETRAFKVPHDFFALDGGQHGYKGIRVTFSRNLRHRDPRLLGYDPPIDGESFGCTFDPDHDQMILCGTARFLEKVAPYLAEAIQHAPSGNKKSIPVPWRDLPLTDAERQEEKRSGHWSDVARSAVVAKLNMRSSSIQSAFDSAMRAAKLPPDLQFKIRIDKAVQFASKDGISLQLGDTTLDEVLRYICELAGAKFVFRSFGIEVLPLTASGRLITRYYRVSWKVLESVIEEPESKPKTGKPVSRDQQLLRTFKDQGIPFGEKTAISYDSTSGELVVRNTAPNLDLCDVFLDSVVNQEQPDAARDPGRNK